MGCDLQNFLLIFRLRSKISQTASICNLSHTNRQAFQANATYTANFEEQYAIMLESDVPVVAQYGRAEPRTVNFYTTPGYCE